MCRGQEDYCVPLVVYITVSKKNTIQKVFYWLFDANNFWLLALAFKVDS